MKHCWNVSTSPRSPAKILPELTELAKFDGHINDRGFQERFTEVLKSLSEFQGHGSEDNESFSARDRIAPMQTYGFVYIDDKTKVIHITAAGHALISARSEVPRQDIWTRQLLKWQFPSPQHCNAQYVRELGMFGREGFAVKPFLVALEIIKRCGGLSKAELAMFVLTKIDMARIARWSSAVEAYRQNRDALPAGRPRKEFTDRAIAMVYDERNATYNPSRTVSAGSAKDYADALFRLLRMTGLVTAKGNRIIIAPERATDVEAILAKNWPLRDDWDDQEAFYEHFGAANQPKLPWEDLAKLRARTMELKGRVQKILDDAKFAVPTIASSLIPPDTEIKGASYVQLSEQYERLIDAFKELKRTSMLGEIRSKTGMVEVCAFFDNITKKIDVFDPPVQLEWNCWRAILALDHTDVVDGNFSVDSNLQPLTRAPGNGPDSAASFPGEFDLLFEPTLKTGRKQFADETEPIAFHAVKHTTALRARGDTRDVYTLAIAPTIHDNVAQYFLTTAKGDIPLPDMTEPPLILPITIAQIQQILIAASKVDGFAADEIWIMLESVREGVPKIGKANFRGYLELIQKAIDTMISVALEQRGKEAA